MKTKARLIKNKMWFYCSVNNTKVFVNSLVKSVYHFFKMFITNKTVI